MIFPVSNPLDVLHKGQRRLPSMNAVAFQTLGVWNKELQAQLAKPSIVF